MRILGSLESALHCSSVVYNVIQGILLYLSSILYWFGVLIIKSPQTQAELPRKVPSIVGFSEQNKRLRFQKRKKKRKPTKNSEFGPYTYSQLFLLDKSKKIVKNNKKKNRHTHTYPKLNILLLFFFTFPLKKRTESQCKFRWNWPEM